MRIAILGGTSQIAKDLVLLLAARDQHDIALFARRPETVQLWLASVGLSARHTALQYAAFSAAEPFDAVMNFVGMGNPAGIAAMGASIFDVTEKFDSMALSYLRQRPQCRYLFLSSGAAYGSSFEKPVTEDTPATFAINNLQPQDWYAAAKLSAELRHRSLPHLPIVDIRVFSYFSRTQDLAARFLITDILRAIRDGAVMQTAPDYVVRDFVHPTDFCNLVSALLSSPASNAVVDCYSRAPIDKPTLLNVMQQNFGLRYEIAKMTAHINLSSAKPYYYSLNKRAAAFGYTPGLTSLDGVMREADVILRATRAGGS